MQLQSGGILGDGTLEGNEESLTTYSDSVLINQLRHAVRSAGRMSQQRVPFSVRDEALSGLKDWWSARFDLCFFNQVCGNTVAVDTRYTGMQATVAPDTNHRIIWCATAASSNLTDASITSTDVFDLRALDYAVERAKSLDPVDSTVYTGVPLRPVMIGGSEYYAAVLHPAQVTNLRTSTNTGQWLDIQKSALQGGEMTDNPIFTGAIGVYNNIALHESARIPLGCDSTTAATSTRRAVFLGAQAAALAFGRDNGPERFTWVEELFDYENQLGVSAGTIFGLKKMRFNSLDFGSIAISTWAVKH